MREGRPSGCTTCVLSLVVTAGCLDGTLPRVEEGPRSHQGDRSRLAGPAWDPLYDVASGAADGASSALDPRPQADHEEEDAQGGSQTPLGPSSSTHRQAGGLADEPQQGETDGDGSDAESPEDEQAPTDATEDPASVVEETETVEDDPTGLTEEDPTDRTPVNGTATDEEPLNGSSSSGTTDESALTT